MNWWTIVKQGKILTLPKTQLRIKKPSKVETDRTCKDKLIEYSKKLATIKMNLINSNLKTTHNITSGDTLNGRWNAIASRENTDGLYAREEIISPPEDTIELIPEEICCAALDLLNSVTKENSFDAGKTRKIGEWFIHSWESERKWHNYNIHKTFNALVLTISHDDENKKMCEFAWEITSGDNLWKDGFTQDIDWR